MLLIFLHSEKIKNISYILLYFNLNYATLRGQYQEERKDTTTPSLHGTKRGKYMKLYARKQRGMKNIDEQRMSKYVVKLRVKVACNQLVAVV